MNDKELDEMLAELVGTPVEYVNLNAGVPEFKQSLQSLVKQAVKEAVEKERSEWHQAAARVDPEVIKSKAYLAQFKEEEK